MKKTRFSLAAAATLVLSSTIPWAQSAPSDTAQGPSPARTRAFDTAP